MNREYVDIIIDWTREDIKQLKLQLEGTKFYPQIKLEDELTDMPKWTCEIIIRKVNDNLSCYADLRYLFEQAPKQLLKKGKKFIVFDGPNPIAEGKILTDFII